MRRLLTDRTDDQALPELAPLKPRPSLSAIRETVATHFGRDPSLWRPGQRVDDASRSIAAYLARRRFGYRATEVALALGYRSPSSVTRAVARVESSMSRLQEAVSALEAKLR